MYWSAIYSICSIIHDLAPLSQGAVAAALEYTFAQLSPTGTTIEAEYLLHLLQSRTAGLGLSLEEAELAYTDIPDADQVHYNHQSQISAAFLKPHSHALFACHASFLQ
jgi:hypothetical protein